jgi:hypothetical protein
MMEDIGDFSSTDLYKMEMRLKKEERIGEMIKMVMMACYERTHVTNSCLKAHRSVFQYFTHERL